MESTRQDRVLEIFFRALRGEDIIVSELLMYKDDPDDKLFKGLMSALYKDHPLTLDVGGEVREVRETTYDLLKLVHTTFYTPSNMVLVICGDVDIDKTMNTIRNKEFINSNIEVKKKEYDVSLDIIKESVIINEDVNNEKLLLGYKLKPLDDLDSETRLRTFIALDLLSSILFSSSSDLYNELINNKYIFIFSKNYNMIRR